MNREIEVLSIEISGNVSELVKQAENAYHEGATHYNTVSGRIVFYKLMSEEEYLTEIEKKIGVTLDGVKARLKAIRENKNG